MTQIVHRPDRDRWEAQDDDGTPLGSLSYALTDGVLDLQHTVVDPAARGAGLGGRLVEAALRHARAEGLLVRPSCPFVPAYLADHPEHRDLVVDEARAAHDDGEGVAHDDGEGVGLGDSVDEAVARVHPVQIRDASIRLGQLLKLAGVVQDGAMARMVIENGEVVVDGAVVTRRGMQVRPGQVVEYAGQAFSPTGTG